MTTIHSTLYHNISALLEQDMLASAVGILRSRKGSDEEAMELLLLYVAENFATRPELFKFNLLQNVYSMLLESGSIAMFIRLYFSLSKNVSDKQLIYPKVDLVLGFLQASRDLNNSKAEEVFLRMLDIV